MTQAVSPHHRLRQLFDRFKLATGSAYHHVDGDLSFKELHRASLALAVELRKGGDAPVLIYGHKNRRFIIAYWAALLSGRTAVPVEIDVAIGRIDHIARISGASEMLLTENHAVSGIQADLDIRYVRATAAVADIVGSVDDTLPIPEDDRCVAYVLFSSGTTGRPKGISVSYANLIDFVDWVHTLTDSYSSVRCVSGNVRYCFDVSLFEMWLSWLSLRPISALDHRDIVDTSGQIERYAEHGLTHWVSTPALALYWLKNKRFNAEVLPDLSCMIFCGEVLSKSLVQALWDRFPHMRILNTYGPTECTVAVTSVEITPDHLDQERTLPIGVPRPGTILTLLNGKEDSGELIITGSSVGLGYLGDSTRQKAQFPAPQTYQTGDWGYMGTDGNWYFEGRTDREIKLNGYRIDLNIVETTIRNCPEVLDVVVDTHPRGRGLRAFVLGCENPRVFDAIATALEVRLPLYMVPRFWFGAACFRFNLNSKLDRGRFVTELSAVEKPYIRVPVAPSTLEVFNA